MNSQHTIYFWGFGLFLGLIVLWALFDLIWGKNMFDNKSIKKSPIKILRSETITQGLEVKVLQEGKGDGASIGKTLTCRYVARLKKDGRVVDTSDDHGGNFSFTLGKRQVIEGWEKGLKGVKAGEKRILTCDAKLAYGSQGSGKIPANEDLEFEVEVIKIT